VHLVGFVYIRLKALFHFVAAGVFSRISTKFGLNNRRFIVIDDTFGPSPPKWTSPSQLLNFFSLTF
jgi:hypothetical protein